LSRQAEIDNQSRVSVASLFTGVITVTDQDLAARWETVLKLFLRIVGSFSILALIFVAVPYSWMNAIHAWLGMGQLPDEPIVGYLARSTSAFYALLGGLLWVVSFDLGRHHVVLVYLGATVTLFGAALLVVDWCEGLPIFWKLWEGPFVIAFGMAMLVLNRAIQVGSDERE
jgi:hypothetical protein